MSIRRAARAGRAGLRFGVRGTRAFTALATAVAVLGPGGVVSASVVAEDAGASGLAVSIHQITPDGQRAGETFSYRVEWACLSSESCPATSEIRIPLDGASRERVVLPSPLAEEVVGWARVGDELTIALDRTERRAESGTVEFSIETSSVTPHGYGWTLVATADTGGESSDPVRSHVTNYALDVSASADRREAKAGERVGYDVVVRNTGEGTVLGGHVSAHLPPGLAFASASDGGAQGEDEGDVWWTIEPLEEGASTTLRVEAVVEASADETVLLVTASARFAGIAGREYAVPRAGSACQEAAPLPALFRFPPSIAGGDRTSTAIASPSPEAETARMSSAPAAHKACVETIVQDPAATVPAARGSANGGFAAWPVTLAAAVLVAGWFFRGRLARLLGRGALASGWRESRR